jgi:hypothetical protein
LKATSLGSISLKYSDARNNSGNGALLDNSASGSSTGISIVNTSSNYGYYSDNELTGLEALTTGTMSVSYVEAARNNGTYGVNLDNSSGANPYKVSITAVRTLTNAGDGLNINAYGPVTMSSLRAIQNVGNGVTVANGGMGVDSIVLGGSSIFSNNGGYGINAYSSKAITLSGILAEGNTGDGIIAYSDNSDGLGVVTIKSSRAYSNEGNGITATSGGNLILESVISLANGGNGADLTVNMADDEDNNIFYGIYVRNSAFHYNTGVGLNLSEEPTSLSGTTYIGNAGGDLVY